MLEVIKETKLYQLNKSINGLYNISEVNGNGLSLWFGEETKNELINLTDKEFNKKAKELL